MNHFDVLILGGGIVGLTAALAMAKRHFTVCVIDAGDLNINESKPNLRVYAINHASKSLLEQLDAWQYLDFNRVSPYDKMYVWDAQSKAHIDFNSRQIATANLGAIIEETNLKKALLEQIRRENNIQLIPNHSVDEFLIEETQVKLKSNENTLVGQLLMIADGANSPSRQKLKVGLTTWSYDQEAIIASVTTEHEHQKTAYQVFHPDGPLAFLPLANPHECSIVWSTIPARASHLMGLDDEAFSEALTKAFAEHLGKIQINSQRVKYPLHMRHVQQYAGSRWILLGDAAHTIHPLAGLGLNVGMADIAAWMKCLHSNKGALVSKKMLGAYQRERKHAVWQTIALMEGFKKLFSYSWAPISTIRGLGMRACNECSPLKRLFIQHAAGVNSMLK